MLLLLGFEASEAAQLAKLLGSEADVAAAAEEDDAVRRLAGGGADVLLCLGPRLSGSAAAAFLERAPAVRAVVLAAGHDPGLFQDFVDSDSVFFLSRRPPPLGE